MADLSDDKIRLLEPDEKSVPPWFQWGQNKRNLKKLTPSPQKVQKKCLFFACVLVILQVGFIFHYYGFFCYFYDQEKTDSTVYPVLPGYQRHWSTKIKTCSAYFEASPESVSLTALEAGKSTVKLTDPEDMAVDCESIKKRGYFPDKPLTEREALFPLAFVRIVYTDYLFLEMQFRSEFQPQNVFCYSIDAKSSPLFKSRMLALQTCFPENVFLADKEANASSSGKGMIGAHLSCLEKLQSKPFEYLFLLQNHDVKVKTNRQLVEILRRFNGANDVSASNPVSISYPHGADYSLKGLNIFKNSSKNAQKDSKGKPISLKIVKSLIQVSLSKKAVSYLINELNLTAFVDTIEQSKYGMDEVFMGTLNANSVLQLPGGYTTKCFNEKTLYRSVTRYTEWTGSKSCLSNKWRHSICIFGVKDLARILQKPHFFANKLMPAVDFGVIDCLAEKLHNLTFFEEFDENTLNFGFYEKLNVVRYNKLTHANNTDFQCNLN